jgi:ribonuclease III
MSSSNPSNNSRFKSDPYNPNNFLIQHSDVMNIMKNLHIHDFKINDIRLYQTAFIHKSYCTMKDYEEFENSNNCLGLFDESYEKMEFLGDALLNSIISQYIYKRYVDYHDIDEGFLTKLKIRFVCGEQLAFLSNKLNFNPYLIISKHIETNCDGRNNINILEDVYESFLGAIFLDTNNLDLVKQFIIKTIEKYVDFSETIQTDTNYKDQILKYIQHNYLVNPYYKTSKDEDNNQFISEIYYSESKNKDEILIETGYGNTKKKAEQDASRKALIQYHVISE